MTLMRLLLLRTIMLSRAVKHAAAERHHGLHVGNVLRVQRNGGRRIGALLLLLLLLCGRALLRLIKLSQRVGMEDSILRWV